MTYHVYILASGRHGTLYVGVTNDLARWIFEHKEGLTQSFTSKYGVTRLVWYEAYEWIDEAIACEKALKKWRRDQKNRLIEEMNPELEDLYLTFNQ